MAAGFRAPLPVQADPVQDGHPSGRGRRGLLRRWSGSGVDGRRPDGRPGL